MTKTRHVPVMLNEVLDFLRPKDDAIYIDGTLGLGGHTKAILESANCQMFCFDRDPESIKLASERLSEHVSANKAKFVNARFSKIPEYISSMEITERKKIKGVLLDLGISSFQLDSPDYGLSFSEECFEKELDMRLDPWCELSAKDILNSWSEKQLADLFWYRADYRKSRALAREIIKSRQIKPFEKLKDFISVCRRVSFVPSASGKNNKKSRAGLHFATLPLMALRMEVNDELGEVSRLLPQLIECLEPEAQIIVISFHSGEDRVVKNSFRDAKDKLEILTKKPLLPSKEEIKANPRSSSAKLRAAKVKDKEKKEA